VCHIWQIGNEMNLYSGSLTWWASSGDRLGSTGDNTLAWTDFADGGYSNTPGDQRVFLSAADAIATDQSKTLAFSITAPSEPGQYRFAARMVRDGETWFGDAVTQDITVTQSTGSSLTHGEPRGTFGSGGQTDEITEPETWRWSEWYHGFQGIDRIEWRADACGQTYNYAIGWHQNDLIEYRLIAMDEGFNWAAFGWSSGEPEREHWDGPWMQHFLRLAGQYPDRIGVALHEYSYVHDSLDRFYPDLVGRFQMLYEVCDANSIPRRKVLVTEFGWVYDDIANSVDQAMNVDLPWAAELYARYPNFLGAATWYLGPGFGGISIRNRNQDVLSRLFLSGTGSRFLYRVLSS
jgi:hypothetical protein